MIDILREHALSAKVMEVLQTGPSELTIVMQSDANWNNIIQLVNKINSNRMLFYPSYTIFYVYDNGRLIDFG